MRHQGKTIPRMMIAAPASGSGKTMITCGLLEAVKRRKRSCVSFKCGPDYIDPMFHKYVLGIAGYNLDSFFLNERQVRELFLEKTAEADLAVIEGVMGYYDGVAGISLQASSYEIARITASPVILVVDGKKSSLSLAALVKGFLEYQKDSRIAGVILNRVSPMMEQRLRPYVEELGIRCFGAVPECEEARLESRHLGLTVPQEQQRLREKIEKMADRLEACLDLEGILTLAESAEEVPGTLTERAGVLTEISGILPKKSGTSRKKSRTPLKKSGIASKTSETLTKKNRLLNGKRKMGIAVDEAFCFYYQENLDFLKENGWELIPFSPLRDSRLPDGAEAVLLGGGYPECYAKELSDNHSMMEEIRQLAASGGKILAECGGFLYLHETLEGVDGRIYRMTGLLPEQGYRTEKLSRFGYITLHGNRGEIRAHEFHYWDSTGPGTAMRAIKPLSTRSWDCMYADDNMIAGFPHLYYRSNPDFILRFLNAREESM